MVPLVAQKKSSSASQIHIIPKPVSLTTSAGSLDVKKGIIEDAKIYGDFFGWGNIADIEAKLKGIRYEKAALDEVLKGVDTKHYFGNIEKNDLLSLIY